MATIARERFEASETNYDEEETACPTPTSDFDPSMPPTPLPKFQLFIVIFIQISEPVTSTVIYPFVGDLIRSLGVTNGDERKTGYYVGVVESIFYAAEALTVLHWGRASDLIGRRPILLGGVFGLALSMLAFGLSKQYWMLILSRCLQGVFNGNIGVMKSVMAEITDSTNIARAFSFLPVAWSLGSTVGPFIGGAFADPATRWPNVFGKIDFFRSYPYFLPCFVAALLPISAFLLSFLGLKETLPSKVASQANLKKRHSVESSIGISEGTPLLRDDASSSHETDYGTLASPEDYHDHPPAKPSIREVLVPSVLTPISNFAFLAFLDQSFLVLLPLIYSTPIKYGGLSLSPATIGIILGGWGVLNGFVQVLVFPWLRKQVGHRNLYVTGIFTLGLCFAMFPLLNRLARLGDDSSLHMRLSPLVWCGVAVQLFLYMFSYMSYACMFMYISASAPSRFLLGTTNGLAQLTASGTRALAPTAASSLFSLSLQLAANGGKTGMFGEYLVYASLIGVATLAVWWSMKLPKGI